MQPLQKKYRTSPRKEKTPKGQNITKKHKIPKRKQDPTPRRGPNIFDNAVQGPAMERKREASRCH